MIEIIGYRMMLEESGGGEYGYKEMEQYEILYTESGILKCCNLINRYGDCYSGRTSATRGKISIECVDNFGEIHYAPIKKIELESIEDFVAVDEDGGCNYYPSGYAKIKEQYLPLFKKTPRAKDLRQVYIFTGESCIGKSYIARNTGITAYETDSNSELPKIISSNIIVLGNKYPFTLDEVKNRIENAEIIVVNFNK